MTKIQYLREEVARRKQELADIEEEERLEKELKETTQKLKKARASPLEKGVSKAVEEGLGLIKKGVKDLHERNTKREAEEKKARKQGDSILDW